MTLEEARRIMADCDTKDSALAIEAVAVWCRFEGIADERLLTIADELESVVDIIKKEKPQ